MRKFTALKSLLVTLAALVSALGLVGSASAAGTWTLSGFPSSGPAGATSTNAKLTDPSSGTQFGCPMTTVEVNGANGTGLSGHPLMQITAFTWSNCSGPLGITSSITVQNLPWSVNADSYDPATGIVTGTITGVELHISGVGCTADIRGPSSTTPGTLDFTYSNMTHVLTITGGDLHVYNVSGACMGLLNNGDPISFTGDFLFSAPIVITSP